MLYMTDTLAETLLETLYCLAISAIGGVEEKDGAIDEKRLQFCLDYAQSSFMALCNEWEETTGETWDISYQNVEKC